MKIKTAEQAIRSARYLKLRKHRQSTKRFLIEGASFVQDALVNGAEIDCLLASDSFLQKKKGKLLSEFARSRGIPFFSVKENILCSLADTETPQGIVAVGRMPVWSEEQVIHGQDTVLVALDGLQDPGNLGTIIRSGAGAGVNGFFLGEGTVDLYNSKVLRSTTGMVFQVPVFHQARLVPLINRLKSLGYIAVAADPGARVKYYRTDFRKGALAIIIGNEGGGISRELLDIADLRVAIPLAEGVESLNAAVAAALILYEICRQRDEDS